MQPFCTRFINKTIPQIKKTRLNFFQVRVDINELYPDFSSFYNIDRKQITLCNSKSHLLCVAQLLLFQLNGLTGRSDRTLLRKFRTLCLPSFFSFPFTTHLLTGTHSFYIDFIILWTLLMCVQRYIICNCLAYVKNVIQKKIFVLCYINCPFSYSF